MDCIEEHNCSEFTISRKHYIAKRYPGKIFDNSKPKKSIDLCHILDKHTNTNKTHYIFPKECNNCGELDILKKIVCNANKRHNITSFVCKKCFQKYQEEKDDFFEKKCFICNQIHPYPKNWKECNLCMQKKKKIISLHCPKSSELTYCRKTRNNFIVRNLCNSCANKWNIREKDCPFCRQNHEWDRETLKYFKQPKRKLIIGDIFFELNDDLIFHIISANFNS